MKNLDEFQKIVLDSVNTVMEKAMVERLSGYSSPLNPLIDDAVNGHQEELRSAINNAFSQTITTEEFKKSLKEAFKHKVARTVTDLLVGKIDKAVNVIRSDQGIKARMIMAIEKIIDEVNFSQK